MIGALSALSVRRAAPIAVAAAAAFLAFAPVASAPALARGPASLADLSEQVIDAVVNISATSTAPATSERRQLQVPQLPPGTPFEEFFEEFFRRGPGGQPQQRRRSNSLGSGFVIDSSGIVVTNNHVIGEANDITVIFNDGTRLKAEIVGKDAKVDLAVLRVKPEKPLKAVKFGDSEKLRVGDWVIAIGNPFGLGGSVSAGIVSARNRNIESGLYDNYIQTDAAINKGNSGGPLFNMDGEVIGINTAILSPSGGSIGIGFAVPSSLASSIVEQLRDFGETRRGWLGVRIQQVDDSLAEAMKLGRARGALIAGVDEKGPGKPAGLETGDVIVKFDGREIRDSRDLPRIVASTPVGKEVEVVVIRKGQELTKTVKLARLDETASASAAPGRPPALVPEVKRVLGLETSLITDEARRRFNLKQGLKGVVVLRVDPDSAAADKRIQPGDVIVEFGDQPVSKPEDISERIEALKKEGRKSAVVVVSNAQGETRFVALSLN
ncbi:MAG: serine protease [Rhizobiales bacterium 65-9]|nr:Do family serine endopeptidase [Hyphomicrobiales bacterium]OJY38631.1 MAG: serine protease [Rhizobiales bacterium 65-9]